jgi:hypothetical protein
MVVENYLAYSDMATTKALKDSIIQAPDVVAIISMEHLIILNNSSNLTYQSPLNKPIWS